MRKGAGMGVLKAGGETKSVAGRLARMKIFLACFVLYINLTASMVSSFLIK